MYDEYADGFYGKFGLKDGIPKKFNPESSEFKGDKTNYHFGKKNDKEKSAKPKATLSKLAKPKENNDANFLEIDKDKEFEDDLNDKIKNDESITSNGISLEEDDSKSDDFEGEFNVNSAEKIYERPKPENVKVGKILKETTGSANYSEILCAFYVNLSYYEVKKALKGIKYSTFHYNQYFIDSGAKTVV